MLVVPHAFMHWFQDIDEDTSFLLRAFSTSEDHIIAFNFRGVRLQVVQRSEGSIWALGPRRALGVGVLDLGCLGVLLVTFGRWARRVSLR